MTKPARKRRRLSLEILGTFAVCFAAAALLFAILSGVTVGLVEEYCFMNDISLEEEELYHLDNTVLSLSFLTSVAFFTILFLALFGEKLGYIRAVIAGVEALREGDPDPKVPLKGHNELTELAESVNFLAETQRNVRAAEERLRQDREELIRSLSHDIRTPLTSIMSYTELLAAKDTVTPEEMETYLTLVARKTAHIRELTDILLDGNHRELTSFADARLLLLQLCEEFEELLEEDFTLAVHTANLPAFSAKLDLSELRRVFDNLASNIGKYADPAYPVTLSVSKDDRGLVIAQSNTIRRDPPAAESHRMGLAGIRRIAQSYKGSMEVREEDERFAITVILPDITG